MDIVHLVFLSILFITVSTRNPKSRRPAGDHFTGNGHTMKCGAHEELSCPACLLTCDSKDNNTVTCAECTNTSQQICICKPGFRYNKRGNCIQAEKCESLNDKAVGKHYYCKADSTCHVCSRSRLKSRLARCRDDTVTYDTPHKCNLHCFSDLVTARPLITSSSLPHPSNGGSVMVNSISTSLAANDRFFCSGDMCTSCSIDKFTCPMDIGWYRTEEECLDKCPAEPDCHFCSDGQCSSGFGSACQNGLPNQYKELNECKQNC